MDIREYASAVPVDVTVAPRAGTTAADLLGAIRDYALERPGRPWLVNSRRPLVLRHASRRAAGVAYRFSRDGDDVTLRVSGRDAWLALAFAVTMLAGPRFARHVERVTIEPEPEVTPGRRK